MLHYTFTRIWQRILTAFALLTTVFSSAWINSNPVSLVVCKSGLKKDIPDRPAGREIFEHSAC